jgi:hypothetical protein
MSNKKKIPQKKEEKSSKKDKRKKEGQHDRKSKETQQKYIRKLHKTIIKPKKTTLTKGEVKDDQKKVMKAAWTSEDGLAGVCRELES